MAEERQFGGQGRSPGFSTPCERISSNQNGHVFVMDKEG